MKEYLQMSRPRPRLRLWVIPFTGELYRLGVRTPHPRNPVIFSSLGFHYNRPHLAMMVPLYNVTAKHLKTINLAPKSRSTNAVFVDEADEDSAGSSSDVLLMLLLGALSHSRPSNSSQPVASRPWLGLRPPRLLGLLCFLLSSPSGLSRVSGPVARQDTSLHSELSEHAVSLFHPCVPVSGTCGECLVDGHDAV